jgi:hypothetical protein
MVGKWARDPLAHRVQTTSPRDRLRISQNIGRKARSQGGSARDHGQQPVLANVGRDHLGLARPAISNRGRQIPGAAASRAPHDERSQGSAEMSGVAHIAVTAGAKGRQRTRQILIWSNLGGTRAAYFGSFEKEELLVLRTARRGPRRASFHTGKKLLASIRDAGANQRGRERNL